MIIQTNDSILQAQSGVKSVTSFLYIIHPTFSDLFLRVNWKFSVTPLPIIFARLKEKKTRRLKRVIPLYLAWCINKELNGIIRISSVEAPVSANQLFQAPSFGILAIASFSNIYSSLSLSPFLLFLFVHSYTDRPFAASFHAALFSICASASRENCDCTHIGIVKRHRRSRHPLWRARATISPR